MVQLTCDQNLCHAVKTSPSMLAHVAAMCGMQLLPEEVPGKCGGPPGNAFELVYAKVTDAVRRAVRKVDPVLAEWIRLLASPQCTLC